MKKILIALATVAHLIPHPFGVSSMGATALYAGAYGPKRSYRRYGAAVAVGATIFFLRYTNISRFDPISCETPTNGWLRRSRRA